MSWGAMKITIKKNTQMHHDFEYSKLYLDFQTFWNQNAEKTLIFQVIYENMVRSKCTTHCISSEVDVAMGK